MKVDQNDGINPEISSANKRKAPDESIDWSNDNTFSTFTFSQ